MNGRATRWFLAVGLILAAGVAEAQPMGAPKRERMGTPMGVPMGRWWESPKVAEQLGLSAEQRQKLEANALSQATAMVDLKASVEKAEITLRAAADAQPFDARRVRDAFGVLQQARLKLEAQRFEMLLKTREVLTTEQWQKLRETARERRVERGRGGPPAGDTEPHGPGGMPH